MKKLIRKFLLWIKYWFWQKPTAKPEVPKATEVINNWIVFKYHEQNICLRRSEIQMWNELGRKDRRAMALRFEIMENKGQIKFQEIGGKTVAIWNKDYQERADKKKL